MRSYAKIVEAMLIDCQCIFVNQLSWKQLEDCAIQYVKEALEEYSKELLNKEFTFQDFLIEREKHLDNFINNLE